MLLPYLVYSQPWWNNSSTSCTLNPYCNATPSVTNHPYLLTAAHGIPLNVNDYKTIIWGTDYCNGSKNDVRILDKGDLEWTLKTTSNDIALLDFLRFPSGIPLYNPYFLGWTINNDNPTNVKSYHHPLGDRLSVSNLTNPRFFQDNDGYKWEFNVSNGIIENGSSGGPVIDQNGRVIGLNWKWASSQPTCSNYKNVKFHVADLSKAWCALKQYLDPGNTGLTAMNGKYYNQNYTALYPSIKGVNYTKFMCTSEKKTFELINYPRNNATNWFFPINNAPFTVVNKGKIADVTATTSASEDYVLKVTVEGCINKTYSKNILVGPPKNTLNLQIEGGSQYYPSPFPCIYENQSQYGVHVDQIIPGATNFEWSGFVNYLNTENHLNASFSPVPEGAPYYGSGYIMYTASNSCGSEILSVGYGPCYSYSISPNPADDYIEITFNPELEFQDNQIINITNQINKNEKIYRDIIIYDSNKEIVKRTSSNENKVIIDILDLKPGKYYLNVNTGGKIEQNIIIID